MEFKIDRTIEMLSRTPMILRTWITGLSTGWTLVNEGPDTWSTFDVIGHLIHGEKTDWIPRIKQIIESGEANSFEPFDRFAQFNNSKGKQTEELLLEFETLRNKNIETLRALPIAENLNKTGKHPALGRVTLQELLAAWVVHDLNHIHQISRVMAHQYEDHVGVWREYLGIIN